VSPGMSLDTGSGFADTAISVYCPGGYIDNRDRCVRY
jgi:hypothetical protein